MLYRNLPEYRNIESYPAILDLILSFIAFENPCPFYQTMPRFHHVHQHHDHTFLPTTHAHCIHDAISPAIYPKNIREHLI